MPATLAVQETVADRAPASPATASALVTLLAGRRSVLLEIRDGDRVERERVRLAFVSDGHHLAVLRSPGTNADAVALGDRVTVSVPVSGSIWRLNVEVLGRGAAEDGALLLAWPTQVERVTGRRQARVAAMCALRVRAGGEGAVAAYTLDMSDTGLQFVHPTPLAPGTELDVRLACLGGTVALTAVVRWQREASAYPEDSLWRVGAQVQAIDAASRHRMLAFLRANAHLRVEANG